MRRAQPSRRSHGEADDVRVPLEPDAADRPVRLSWRDREALRRRASGLGLDPPAGRSRDRRGGESDRAAPTRFGGRWPPGPGPPHPWLTREGAESVARCESAWRDGTTALDSEQRPFAPLDLFDEVEPDGSRPWRGVVLRAVRSRVATSSTAAPTSIAVPSAPAPACEKRTRARFVPPARQTRSGSRPSRRKERSIGPNRVVSGQPESEPRGRELAGAAGRAQRRNGRGLPSPPSPAHFAPNRRAGSGLGRRRDEPGPPERRNSVRGELGPRADEPARAGSSRSASGRSDRSSAVSRRSDRGFAPLGRVSTG